MNPSTLTQPNGQFNWVGQFSGFVPGEKSPYQYLAIDVATDDAQTVEPQQQVKLNKSLRRMLLGYLHPQDWIGVVGKSKLDPRTGNIQWKAREIVKLSPQQISQSLKSQVSTDEKQQDGTKTEQAETKPAKNQPAKTEQPIRILICQKSSCRQKGSQSVEAAIARILQNKDLATPIQIQPTGCMKQCKAGPHVVLIPPKQFSPPTQTQCPKAMQRHTRVTPLAASQIIQPFL
ncbi:MAG: (2Fe-2S) ferredoxin domain-containing protein [Cyanobacteria bacterium J06621_11]